MRAMKSKAKTIEEYLAALSDDKRAALQRLRNTIRAAAPRAEECISYQMPAYRLHGGAVLSFAGWKQHYSLYGATGHLVQAFEDDLAPYEVDKGTIRFPMSRPVPVKLIERIAKFRAREAAERAQKKLAAAPKRR